MFRLSLLLALVPVALRAQIAPLAGKIEGDTYISATREFSLPLPVLRELGGTVTDTENVVTFSDSYSTHISIACFPQDSLQRWELETRGRRDYLLYFFTDFVLADFDRRFPGSKIESARFVPELHDGALITYADLPGGSHFEPKDGVLGPASANRVTAKRGTLLFVRHGHVFILSTELAERATQRSTYDATPEKENTQLTARLTELAGRLIFPVPPLRS
ncbi:MAG TPA: hypothetical protein PLQ52_02075 [Lacunisphaera sp.]|jgi:hypothetical protein|nr:hypothetical protein [Lacunisphaera sp.]HQY04829.1 hypothetical protein [Lacunisphaera sp.]